MSFCSVRSPRGASSSSGHTDFEYATQAAFTQIRLDVGPQRVLDRRELCRPTLSTHSAQSLT